MLHHLFIELSGSENDFIQSCLNLFVNYFCHLPTILTNWNKGKGHVLLSWNLFVIVLVFVKKFRKSYKKIQSLHFLILNDVQSLDIRGEV